MRIAHLVDSFSRLSETFVYDQVREVERQVSGSTVFALDRENAEARPFPSVAVVRDASVGPWRRKLHRGLSRVLPSMTAREWRADRQALTAALRKREADVLHAHFGPMGVFAAPVARALGIPLVVSFYGFDASRLLRERRWVDRYRLLWTEATRIVVLSQHMARRLEACGCPREKIVIVHLARPLGDFPFRSPAASVRQLLSVGRLVEKKGHLDSLRAVAAAARKGIDVRLTIVGEGEQRPALERYIRDHGLSSRASLVGEKPSREIREHMERADAFLLPSRTARTGDEEGTPTVLMEAQAIGLPCVSTRHAGIPEMMPPENHWLLADEGDVAGLASRIEGLSLCDAAELAAIATRGRQYVEQHFDLTDEVRRLVEIYRDVAA